MKVLLTLSIIALVIRLAAISFWHFDGLYGQDSFAYLQQGAALLENALQGKLPPVDFFWPNGYPLLIAVFMAGLGQTAFAAQLASLLCGIMLSPLVYLLSKDLWSPEAYLPDYLSTPAITNSESRSVIGHRAGILAGLIVAVAGQPILSSIVVMSDIPALFWATLATWLIVRSIQHGRLERLTESILFLAVGAALALSIISRWIYIVIGPALVAYTIFNLHRHQKKWRILLLPLLSSILILGPQLWLSFNKPEGLFHSWLVGWRPSNFFLYEFKNVDGHFVYQWPIGIFYAQPAAHPAYIFPLLGWAALWGIWRLWQSKRWGAFILLMGWAGPVYLFLAGIPYQNFRFGLSLYIPLVILTSFGLSDCWQRLEQRFGILPTRRVFTSSLVKIAIGLCLFGMILWAYSMLNSFLTTQNQSKRITYQVAQILPADATLITFGLTLTFQHYTHLKIEEFFYLDETDLYSLTTQQTPVYLLLNIANIESQWQGKPLQQNYRWLKTHTTLTVIDHFQPYTLYKIIPDPVAVFQPHVDQ